MHLLRTPQGSTWPRQRSRKPFLAGPLRRMIQQQPIYLGQQCSCRHLKDTRRIVTALATNLKAAQHQPAAKLRCLPWAKVHGQVNCKSTGAGTPRLSTACSSSFPGSPPWIYHWPQGRNCHAPALTWMQQQSIAMGSALSCWPVPVALPRLPHTASPMMAGDDLSLCTCPPCAHSPAFTSVSASFGVVRMQVVGIQDHVIHA